MKITYKEFFEKSKEKSYLQRIVLQCFSESIKTVLLGKKVFPDKPKVDAGELMLNAIDTLCRIEGIILRDREEITAEYMSNIINSYK